MQSNPSQWACSFIVLCWWLLPTQPCLGQYSAIDIDGFADGIKHFRDRTANSDYPRYELQQIVEIGDNLLAWQRANGGWPANQDPLRKLSPAELAEVIGQREALDTSFDNRNTYSQIAYLAGVYWQTKEERFRRGCERGLEFLLSAQYPNGGWPHSFPRDTEYYPHVTLADDVMTGILSTLRPISTAQEPYAWLSSDLRQRAAAALAAGDDCLLKMQIEVNGQLTAWAGQYDRHTLQPIMGRTYELPSLVSSESVSVIRYLMSIDQPTSEVIRAVDAAVAWLERSALQGIRVERIEAETVRYQNHTSTYDVVVVEDPTAPPIWSRFYEIETNRPFMANRDGKKVYKLADVARERRTGYGWYTGAPASLLRSDYPQWQARIAAQGKPSRVPF